ncbi:chorismate mutase [Streptomyces yaizuensis]|uniref:Chorismate mutase domain-containing protein n=1 Tax=Streptomyces yaizuensis TaxID=2989713 RepID=A0ABQ5P5Q9_9ACTN|nr:chorismate mutase [Streptomyces sp. YSPA8]GLF97933.1 hypothetical protein SYYSPA8_26570 [Streptomyces sp. YSPA8]
MSRPSPAGARSQRAHLAHLDHSIIALIRQRTEICLELAALRRAEGGPAIELARENEVLRRYHDALGPSGTSVALLLTELGRRAEGAVRAVE